MRPKHLIEQSNSRWELMSVCALETPSPDPLYQEPWKKGCVLLLDYHHFQAQSQCTLPFEYTLDHRSELFEKSCRPKLHALSSLTFLGGLGSVRMSKSHMVRFWTLAMTSFCLSTCLSKVPAEDEV